MAIPALKQYEFASSALEMQRANSTERVITKTKNRYILSKSNHDTGCKCIYICIFIYIYYTILNAVERPVHLHGPS